MSAITFDTLQFVQTLEEAGVERKQASAIAMAVRDTHDAADLATKGDLRTEVALVRKDIDALENRLVIKMAAVMAGLAALAVAANRLWQIVPLA